jgi:hypothetical protein
MSEKSDQIIMVFKKIFCMMVTLIFAIFFIFIFIPKIMPELISWFKKAYLFLNTANFEMIDIWLRTADKADNWQKILLFCLIFLGFVVASIIAWCHGSRIKPFKDLMPSYLIYYPIIIIILYYVISNMPFVYELKLLIAFYTGYKIDFVWREKRPEIKKWIGLKPTDKKE